MRRCPAAMSRNSPRCASRSSPVSGGELQRLSVARALLADRPVLLLDEPTAHLDSGTAAAVLDAVLGLAAGRSLLWITHEREDLRLFPEVRSLLPSSPRPTSLGLS